MLDQVEYESKVLWDSSQARRVTMHVWRRASSFQAFLGSSQVRLVGGIWCCHSLDDAERAGARKRKTISLAHARSMLDRHNALRGGQAASWAQLQELASVHLFAWPQGASSGWCTCPAARAYRVCYHILAAGLKADEVELPAGADTIPVGLARRGQKRKQGNRYEGPPPPDARDLRILQLETALRDWQAAHGRGQEPPRRRIRVKSRRVE